MSNWSNEDTVSGQEPEVHDWDEEDVDEVPSETVDRLREDVRRLRSAHGLALEREAAASEHARVTAARLIQAQQRYASGLERDLEEALRRTPTAERVLPELGEHLDIRPIVQRLMSSSAATRLEAKQQYNNMGFEAVGPLLKLMQREGVGRNRRIAIAAGAAVFTIVLVFGRMWFMPDSLIGDRWGYTNIVILALLGTLLFYTGPSAIQKKAAQLLSEFDDPRLIGPLAECLNTTDAYTSRVAAAGLKQMLPRVRASDARVMSPESLGALYRALAAGDPDLSVAILRSLEQIGDEKAFPIVEKLADMQPRSSGDRRVKKAAEDCLPGLLDRARSGAIGSTLLRAAQAPEPAESLLRPVAQSGEADPMELLRAADPEA